MGLLKFDGAGIATQQVPPGRQISFVITDGGSGLILLPTVGFGNHRSARRRFDPVQQNRHAARYWHGRNRQDVPIAGAENSRH